jgi:hypothetical protein
MANNKFILVLFTGFLLSSCSLFKASIIHDFRVNEWQLVSLYIKDSVPPIDHKTKIIRRDPISKNLIYVHLTVNKNQLQEDSIKFVFTREKRFPISRYRKYTVELDDSLIYSQAYYQLKNINGSLIFHTSDFSYFYSGPIIESKSDTIFPYLDEFYYFPQNIDFEVIIKGDTLLMTSSKSNDSIPDYIYQYVFVKM